MGWADCGEDSTGRPIGYAHSATCDHPGCDKKIDRGLAYACGGMHGEEEYSCEKYFCEKHLFSADLVSPAAGESGCVGVCPACYDLGMKSGLFKDD